jgi:uracil-DNA glycosylase
MDKIEPKIHESWKKILSTEFKSDYFSELKSFLIIEKQQHRIFPISENIFRAFDLTPFNKVKVVILGQDPYHGDGQSHGLSFSVPEGIAHPPSLVNIFKELKNDLNIEKPVSGNLEA